MIRQHITSLVAFTVIDGIWLGFIAPHFYRANIGHLMRDQPDLVAAMLFYMIFLIGLNFFVITPQREASLGTATLHGALFGFVTYATFDLTSAAVFKGFPYLVVFIDMIWGATLCASITALTLWSTRAQAHGSSS